MGGHTSAPPVIASPLGRTSGRWFPMPSQRTIPHVCEQCGITFLTRPDAVGRYCSWACSGKAKQNQALSTCPTCGKQFQTRASRKRVYCSEQCQYAGQHKPGSTSTTHDGYEVVVVAPNKKRPRHRVLMEEVLGRPLMPDEDVHHINGVRTDNRIENLIVLSHREHASLHGASDRWSREYDACVSCGQTTIRHRGHGLCRTCWSRLRDVRRSHH